MVVFQSPRLRGAWRAFNAISSNCLNLGHNGSSRRDYRGREAVRGRNRLPQLRHVQVAAITGAWGLIRAQDAAMPVELVAAITGGVRRPLMPIMGLVRSSKSRDYGGRRGRAGRDRVDHESIVPVAAVPSAEAAVRSRNITSLTKVPVSTDAGGVGALNTYSRRGITIWFKIAAITQGVGGEPSGRLGAGNGVPVARSQGREERSG